jgi:hypothetical protein
VFLFCLLDRADGAGGIFIEVAVDGIDLADGDAHVLEFYKKCCVLCCWDRALSA